MKIKYEGTEYELHLKDTVQLGFGANPDGSFMYMVVGANEPVGKEHAMKKLEVRRIKYFKKLNLYRVELFAPYLGWVHFDTVNGNTALAVEKKELILKKK